MNTGQVVVEKIDAGEPLSGAQAQADRRLLLFCLAYVAAVAAYQPQHYVTFLTIYGSSLVTTVLPVVLLFVLGLAFAKHRQAPTQYLKRLLGPQFVNSSWSVLVFLISISAFTTWKYNIPAVVPFYGYAYFADLDRSIHGADAWRIAHAALPDWSIYVIQPVYSMVWFSLWFGVVFFVTVRLDAPERNRYLWSLALTMLLVGTVLATLFSSVGPVLYDRFLGDARFRELTDTLAGTTAGQDTLRYAAYLFDSYRSGDEVFGSGISAMPSVHVAIAVLNAIMFSTLGWRLGAAGWAFALLIFTGSVYTGWHYAVDGYLSAIVVFLVWIGVSKAFSLPALGRKVRKRSPGSLAMQR
jgi:hypothetical protein